MSYREKPESSEETAPSGEFMFVILYATLKSKTTNDKERIYHTDMVRAETKMEAVELAMENLKKKFPNKTPDIEHQFEVLTRKSFWFFHKTITVDPQHSEIVIKRWWTTDKFKILKSLECDPDKNIMFLTRKDFDEGRNPDRYAWRFPGICYSVDCYELVPHYRKGSCRTEKPFSSSVYLSCGRGPDESQNSNHGHGCGKERGLFRHLVYYQAK